MRRAADGVGTGQAVRVHLYRTWSTKERAKTPCADAVAPRAVSGGSGTGRYSLRSPEIGPYRLPDFHADAVAPSRSLEARDVAVLSDLEAPARDVVRKGGKKGGLALHPQTAQRNQITVMCRLRWAVPPRPCDAEWCDRAAR